MSSSSQGQPRKRAVVYVRVSHERAGMISPELQLVAAQKLALENGYEIVDVVQDIDISGRSSGKRQIQHIIETVQEGEVEVLILWTWSRFGRNVLESLQNLKVLTEAGGTVRAVKEDFDGTTSIGKFAITQMLAIAELQSDQMGDTWREVYLRRQREGLPHTNRGRFGYTLCDSCPPKEKGQPRVTCEKCLDGVLKVDPVTGPALAEAYRRHARGDSLRSITLWLRAEGFRSLKGNVIEPTALLSIMDSGFGMGYVRYRSQEMRKRINSTTRNRVRGRRPETFDLYLPGKHAPVIEDPEERERLWEAHLERRKIDAGTPKRLLAPRYSLSGLLRCAGCNRVMGAALRPVRVRHPELPGGHPDPRDVVFRCLKGQVSKACDQSPNATLNLVERKVLEWLQAEAAKSGSVELLPNQRLRTSDAEAMTRKLEQQLETAQAEIGRLVDGFVRGIIPEGMYISRKSEKDLEIASLQSSLREQRARERSSTRPSQEKLLVIVNDWEHMPPERRRQALGTVIKCIHVRKGWKNDPRKYEFVPTWALDEA